MRRGPVECGRYCRKVFFCYIIKRVLRHEDKLIGHDVEYIVGRKFGTEAPTKIPSLIGTFFDPYHQFFGRQSSAVAKLWSVRVVPLSRFRLNLGGNMDTRDPWDREITVV